MNTPIDRQGELNLDECRFAALGTSVQRAKRLRLTNVVALQRSKKAFGQGRKFMAAMSRRAVLTNILPGAVVAIAGVATIGWAVAPEVADAMPLAIAKGNHVKVDDLVEKAQVVVHPSR